MRATSELRRRLAALEETRASHRRSLIVVIEDVLSEAAAQEIESIETMSGLRWDRAPEESVASLRQRVCREVGAHLVVLQEFGPTLRAVRGTYRSGGATPSTYTPWRSEQVAALGWPAPHTGKTQP